jgi:hypothetical protein
MGDRTAREQRLALERRSAGRIRDSMRWRVEYRPDERICRDGSAPERFKHLRTLGGGMDRVPSVAVAPSQDRGPDKPVAAVTISAGACRGQRALVA